MYKSKWLNIFLFVGVVSALHSQSLQDVGFSYPKTRVLAPNINLKMLSNQMYDIKKDEGKIIIVHFWATWCKPCMKELPELNLFFSRLDKNSIKVLTVNVDRSNESRVRSMVKKLNLKMPVLLDPKGKVRNAYEVVAFPTTFIVGRDKKFIARVMGVVRWEKLQISLLKKL